MSDSLKQKATHGILWSALERVSVQGVQFIISIIMARLLTPDDYGLIGMLGIFLAISQSLIDSGFSQALIRKQDITETDFSTVFYFNIVVSFSIYLLLYSFAPSVAEFYNKTELCSVMRALCFVIVINSFSIVQNAKYIIKIDFKTIAKISLIATGLSGTIGIYLAYKGYGVWALVYQSLINATIRVMLLWLASKWKPLQTFSWSSFHELFSFGSKLMISALIEITYQNINPIIIGKIFSAGDLGNYSRAHHFSEFPSSNVTNILQRVTYPILCNIQNDEERLRNIYRRFLKLSSFLIFPLMTGLAAVAYPFISITIGDKWMFCAQLLQIICFNMMWYPVHAINLNLLQVKGRSDLFLRLEIIKKIFGITIICITVPMGVVAMCYGGIVSSIISLIINTYYTGKLINVGFLKQMRDLLPIICLSIGMFIFVQYTINIIPNTFMQLICGVSLGILIYLFGSYLLKFPELKEVMNIIRRK